MQKHLPRYHDAELAPGARVEVEHHLATCPQCRAALAQLHDVAGHWANLASPPVPPGFAERVMLAARQRTARTAQRTSWLQEFRWWWREQTLAMRAAATAVVVVASVTGMLLSGGFVPRPVSTSADGPTNAAFGVGEQLRVLSGAPDGSLEQTYLAWTFPSGPSRKQP